MFYTSSMGKGGAERVISVLSNNLILRNNICIVLNTTKNIAYELDPRIKLIELDKAYNKFSICRNIKRIITTKKIIEKEKPDIIISFLPIPSYRILSLKNEFQGTQIIVADRNDPKEEYKTLINKILMKLLYKRADGFVFQTKEQKEYFDKKIQDRSVIIHNPIKEEFLQTNLQNIIKEKTIISVGRLVEQKNQKMLINAFSKIAKKNEDYILKIFGNGPLKEKLQEQIESLQLDDRIKICGISDNIKEELEKGEIFVLPSNYEGMPNALIEAMSVGLPCISTDCPCGGPRELIENEKNGLLIPVNDEKILQKKLEILIDNNKLRMKIGEEAKKIREKLEISKIIKCWEKYIEYIHNKEHNINEN